MESGLIQMKFASKDERTPVADLMAEFYLSEKVQKHWSMKGIQQKNKKATISRSPPTAKC